MWGAVQSTLGSDIPGLAAQEKVRKVVVHEPGEQSIKVHFSVVSALVPASWFMYYLSSSLSFHGDGLWSGYVSHNHFPL